MPPIGMTIVDRYAIFEFWKGIASKRSIIEFFVGKQLSKIWGLVYITIGRLNYVRNWIVRGAGTRLEVGQ
jgi:hypothetical protein